jgi:hypothetical protein
MVSSGDPALPQRFYQEAQHPNIITKADCDGYQSASVCESVAYGVHGQRFGEARWRWVAVQGRAPRRGPLYFLIRASFIYFLVGYG